MKQSLFAVIDEATEMEDPVGKAVTLKLKPDVVAELVEEFETKLQRGGLFMTTLERDDKEINLY